MMTDTETDLSEINLHAEQYYATFYVNTSFLKNKLKPGKRKENI